VKKTKIEEKPIKGPAINQLEEKEKSNQSSELPMEIKPVQKEIKKEISTQPNLATENKSK
jgi:hypothetical protein